MVGTGRRHRRLFRPVRDLPRGLIAAHTGAAAESPGSDAEHTLTELTSGGGSVLDLVFLTTTAGFFALAIAYVAACERLMK